MVFWAFCALKSYPWFVPADHNASAVHAGERVAYGCCALLAASTVSLLLVAGAFGEGRAARVIASLLLLVVVGVTPWLYLTMADATQSPFRLSAQFAGALVAILGLIRPIGRH